jgi:translation elongation factor EF-G
MAGEIAAGVGLKATTTGDTLAADSATDRARVDDLPDPVIAVAVEPKSKADQDKLSTGLARLAEEDPTFRVETDEETGQTLISGMGQRTSRSSSTASAEFNVDANVGRPQVAYRETISKPAERSGASSSGRPAAQASTATSSSTSTRRSRARATSSSTRSSAARSRRSTSRQSTPGSRRSDGLGHPRGLPRRGHQNRAGRRVVP